MDSGQVAILRELLSSTDWPADTRRFARTLRRSARDELLLFGTPEEEPWHLAAHLDDEAKFVPALRPTLVRWNPPAGAPAHLAVGLDRLKDTRRGEALFVVADGPAPEPLLDRVDDARRSGAVILTLDGGDRELTGLAHDALTVKPGGLVTFEQAQHLVSTAAGEEPQKNKGFRDRLARFLDVVSGPQSGQA
ncbi:hypothetical protein [Actinocorallia longicatena]|uniref:Uncharacterized protein n=1 Tax=Actinocorallia longicatena TaxID=111803 RepID=A0ABP6QE20_9ACTN